MSYAGVGHVCVLGTMPTRGHSSSIRCWYVSWSYECKAHVYNGLWWRDGQMIKWFVMIRVLTGLQSKSCHRYQKEFRLRASKYCLLSLSSKVLISMRFSRSLDLILKITLTVCIRRRRFFAMLPTWMVSFDGMMGIDNHHLQIMRH